jgi:uncharacterized protein (DUF1697 family)
MNAKMPELKAAFEAAGFADVRTVVASGNVVFSANGRSSEATLQRKAEAAMRKHLGRDFLTIVRPIDALRDMLESNPFEPFRVKSAEKRIVTFLRDHPETDIAMPISEHGARILCRNDREIFTAYVPVPEGAMFMGLIERTFGKAVTTRTWDTIAKVVRAGDV